MVNMHLKEQKTPRNPNKHPNSNRDAPKGTNDAQDAFGQGAKTAHKLSGA